MNEPDIITEDLHKKLSNHFANILTDDIFEELSKRYKELGKVVVLIDIWKAQECTRIIGAQAYQENDPVVQTAAVNAIITRYLDIKSICDGE